MPLEDAAPARWTARWIWDEPPTAAPPARHTFRLFRRTFEAPGGARVLAHVSADSRYQLFVNGARVSVGPCKGDGWRKHFETVDISPFLTPGRNVLAARVLHFRPYEPPVGGGIGAASIWRTAAGGFFLQAEVEGGERLDTDGGWKVRRDDSVAFHVNPGAVLVGETETRDGAAFPHGWHLPDFHDGAWTPAVPVAEGLSPEQTLNLEFFGPWSLMPRPIPPMFETERRFVGSPRARGSNAGDVSPQDVAAALCGECGPAVLPPNTEWEIDLDAGEETTGYPRLRTSGGAGSAVRLTYAEAYTEATPDDPWGRKGRRDDAALGGIAGVYDEVQPGGGEEIYEPFWFRTFRYVRVTVRTGDAPLSVGLLDYVETGYPLEVLSAFEASDRALAPLWDISIRTLRRCMHETYEDCPYYEQLQYAMDTRLEALFSSYLSADDRLMRKAIHDYHCGWHPSGLLQSRFPSVFPQIIPGFSLHWVMMVHDHWRLFGDAALVRRYRATVDGVLDWFDRELTPDGLVGAFAYWPYFDWVKGWHHGCPPGAPDQPATVFSLLYAAALETAAELAEPAGTPARAAEYRERAAAVNEGVNRRCWDQRRGLYRDGPETHHFSVHAQTWAILSGAATGERAIAIAAAALDDGTLDPMNWAMQFFLFRALRRAGMYERAFELYDGWHGLVRQNVTTWPEDPVNGRSDCHGWGSVPIHEFLAEILGVQPEGPGFASVRIAPQPGPLAWARGSVATPRGPVSVKWERDGAGIRVDATAPENTPLTLYLPKGATVSGRGRVSGTG